MNEQERADRAPDELAAFYAEHYAGWKVHALPLLVYVPLASGDDAQEALALVREILEEASFDIRVQVIPPAPPATLAAPADESEGRA